MRHTQRGGAGLAASPPSCLLSLPPSRASSTVIPAEPPKRHFDPLCVRSLPPLPCSPPSRLRSPSRRVRNPISLAPLCSPFPSFPLPRASRAPRSRVRASKLSIGRKGMGPAGNGQPARFARTAPRRGGGRSTSRKGSNRIASACPLSPPYTSLYSVGGLGVSTDDLKAVVPNLRRPAGRNEAARLINAKTGASFPKHSPLTPNTNSPLCAPCRPHYQHPDCALSVPGPSSLAEYRRLRLPLAVESNSPTS